MFLLSKCQHIVSILGLLMIFSNAVFAANEQFVTAIALYKSKKFAEALPKFINIANKEPNNILNHYYLALCYQALHQSSQAKKEYQFVYSHTQDQSMRASALYGLSQVLEYQKSSPSANVSTTSVSNSASPRTIVRNSRGRIKVLEFYTTWCSVCHRYEPVFNSVKAKYSAQADFESYNAEDPGNSELVQRYSISRYPTTVFVDKGGNMLDRFEGGANEAGLVYKLNNALQAQK